MNEEDNFSGDCLDLTVKDVCFNCDNGFVLGNRKQLLLYSHLLRKIVEKCPSNGSQEKRCIVLNTVMYEGVELLLKAVNKGNFVRTTNEKMGQIWHAAKTLGMKLEEATKDDGFIAFKAIPLNSVTDVFTDNSLEDDVEITANNPFHTIEVNESNSESNGFGESESESFTEAQKSFITKDICFNCCDGIILGNREQLSLYSSTLKQIFRDYPRIANDVSRPGICKGIFLSNSHRDDVSLLFETIDTRDLVRVNSQKILRIRHVAHVLGMKLKEFPSKRGFVWLRVEKAESGDTSNQLTKVDITEITHNKSFEKNQIVDVSDDSSIGKQTSEEINEKDTIDLAVKDICFNCENGLILGNRRQLKLYSAFLRQLFEEYPNIVVDNSLPYDKKGINLPSVRREDVETLFQAINKGDFVTVKIDRMAGIRHAASILQMNMCEFLSGETLVYFKIKKADSVDFTSDMWNATGDSISNDVLSDNDTVRNTHERNKVRSLPMLSLNKNPRGETSKDVDDDDDDYDDDDDEDDYDDEDFKVVECPNDSVAQNKKEVTPAKYIGKARRSVPFKVLKNEGNKPNQSIESVARRTRNVRQPKSEKSKIRCKCGKQFDNSVYFYKHRVNCDSYRKDAIICDICDNPFKNQFSLKIHKSRIHKGVKEQNECCCGAVFTFKGTLRNHQQTCGLFRRTALHCYICDLFFQSQTDYFVHTNSRAHLNKSKQQLEFNF